MAIRAPACWENPPVCASRLVAVVAVVAVSSDGAGEWAPVAACGQIGCNCGAFAPYFFKIGRNCGAFAPYFFGFSFSLPVEAVFKGVQSMQITLTFVYLNRCMGLYHAHESGRYTAPLLCILFLTRIPDAVGA